MRYKGLLTMARDWIKIRSQMRTHPKVIRMTRFISTQRPFMDWWAGDSRNECNEIVTETVRYDVVTRVTVAGLIDVWHSVSDVIDSNDCVTDLCAMDISDIAEIPCFGEAMVEVGWAIPQEDGSMKFPNFREFNTPDKDRKAPKSNAQRQQEYRDRQRNESVTK